MQAEQGVEGSKQRAEYDAAVLKKQEEAVRKQQEQAAEQAQLAAEQVCVCMGGGYACLACMCRQRLSLPWQTNASNECIK